MRHRGKWDRNIYSWRGRVALHWDEYWILYLWLGAMVSLITVGVIACDGNGECLRHLANSID